MSVICAVLLGAVQGVCSLLPVSGMGHMALLADALGIHEQYSLYFAILLNVGTAAAVCVYFYKDMFRLITELGMICRDLLFNAILYLKGTYRIEQPRKIITNPYRQLLVLMIMALIPTALIGWLMMPFVVGIFDSVLAAAMGFWLNALLLYMASLVQTDVRLMQSIKCRTGLVAGVFHGFSCIPGFSRTASVAVAGRFLGFPRKLAVKLSLLLSVPTSIGALILALSRDLDQVSFPGVPACLAGVITSAIVSWFVVRVAARSLQRMNYRFYMAYCLLIGGLSVITYLI